MAKRVFFSFHYQDVIDFRANVVRQHWVMKDREEAGYFDASMWESAKKRGSLKQLIDGARIHDRAGQDVGADLRAFFDNAHVDVLAAGAGKLLQANRGRESRRPRADDDNVVFHRFAWRKR